MGARRIGILTGGGDCPGLNPVIRAVVKRARNEYGFDLLGVEDGFTGLMEEGRVRPLQAEDVVGILPKGGTILGTSNRADPYRDAQGRDRSAEVAERMRRLEMDALVLVGGDGTQTIGHRLAQDHGVNIVGVPKTIDNDLMATDLTFGFDSARAYATEAIDRLHSTAESHDRVMVVEVMGRNSGFIALHAGLAGGADVILIPEIPYDLEAVTAHLRRRHARGRTFSIVVVAEGAVPRGGGQIVQEDAGAVAGRNVARLGGVGHQVARQISETLMDDTRVTVLGHLQRGGSPTPFDRILGTRFGFAALGLVAEERYGRMVALRGQDIVDVSIEDAVSRQRTVDPRSDLVRSAEAMGIAFGA